MRAKPSLKATLAANRAAGRNYAAMYGKEPMPMDVEPDRLPRKKSAVQLPKRSEADVQRDVLSWLKRDPRVAIYERHNSGALPDKTGRMVRFNRVTVRGGNGIKPLISDITGTLKNGMGFAFECKEPNWKLPDFDALLHKDGLLSDRELRELGQEAYLIAVRNAGGIGMFITDVQQVIDILQTHNAQDHRRAASAGMTG